MTLPVSPNSISMSQIQTEFGGSNPISLSEYYRGGTYVPSGTSNGGRGLIATSGAISMDTFHGTSASIAITASFVNNGNNSNWAPETAYTLTLNLASMGNPSGSFSYTITVTDVTKAAINSYTSSYNGSPSGSTDQNGYETISGTFSVGNATAIANIPVPRTQATSITATITRSGYTTYTSTLAVPVDTSQSYTWITYPSTVDEGSAATYTYQIQTSQATGASYPYQYFKWEIWLSFITGNVIAEYADFPASQGYFATAASSPSYFGAFTVTPLADLVTEGYEYFEVRVKTSDYVQLTTPPIRINDTSLTPTLYGPYTPGSATWGTVPSGKTKCVFVLIGGGGGGASAGGYGAFAGGGGAAGQVLLYDYADAVSVTPGDTVSYSIGAAGAGGGGDGSDGQNSIFTIGSTPYYALGGKGGKAAGDGSGGYVSGIDILGGQGYSGGVGGSAGGGGGTGNGVSGGGENGGNGNNILGIGSGGAGGSARIADLHAGPSNYTILGLRVGAGGGGGAVSTGNGTAYGGKGGSDGGNYLFYGGNGSSGAGNGGTATGGAGYNYGNGGGGAAAYSSGGTGGDGSSGALWFYFF